MYTVYYIVEENNNIFLRLIKYIDLLKQCPLQTICNMATEPASSRCLRQSISSYKLPAIALELRRFRSDSFCWLRHKLRLMVHARWLSLYSVLKTITWHTAAALRALCAQVERE